MASRPRPEPIHPKPAPTTPKPKPGPKHRGGWIPMALAVIAATIAAATKPEHQW